MVSATSTLQRIFMNVVVFSRLPADLRVFSGRVEFYCAVVLVDWDCRVIDGSVFGVGAAEDCVDRCLKNRDVVVKW